MVKPFDLQYSLMRLAEQSDALVAAFDGDRHSGKQAMVDVLKKHMAFHELAQAIELHMREVEGYKDDGLTHRYPDSVNYVMYGNQGFRMMMEKSYYLAQALFPDGNEHLDVVDAAYEHIGIAPPTQTSSKALQAERRVIENALELEQGHQK